MKTKALLIVGLCMFSVSCMQSYASEPSLSPLFVKENSIPDGYEKIVLHGDLTSVGPNAIEAGANDNAVYIQFNQNLGNVSITIYNSSNLVVYGTMVDTSVQQVVVIPFATAPTDSYTVVLNRADSYAEGEFERD